jgi:hypothetical protein
MYITYTFTQKIPSNLNKNYGQILNDVVISHNDSKTHERPSSYRERNFLKILHEDNRTAF